MNTEHPVPDFRQAFAQASHLPQLNAHDPVGAGCVTAPAVIGMEGRDRKSAELLSQVLEAIGDVIDDLLAKLGKHLETAAGLALALADPAGDRDKRR